MTGLRGWWPVLAWMGVIVVATSVPVPTPPLLARGLPWDKLAHLLLYGVLGVTLGRGLWVTERRTPGAVWVAFGVGVLFGALDEWHQGALRSRQASFADWLADVAGVALGLAAHLWPRWRRAWMAGADGPNETT